MIPPLPGNGLSWIRSSHWLFLTQMLINVQISTNGNGKDNQISDEKLLYSGVFKNHVSFPTITKMHAFCSAVYMICDSNLYDSTRLPSVLMYLVWLGNNRWWGTGSVPCCTSWSGTCCPSSLRAIGRAAPVWSCRPACFVVNPYSRSSWCSANHSSRYLERHLCQCHRNRKTSNEYRIYINVRKHTAFLKKTKKQLKIK